MSPLLDRRRAGGDLLGRTVNRGKAVLCAEENDSLWALRQPPLELGPDLHFRAPIGDSPSRGRWKWFIDDLLKLSFRQDPFDLLVVDTAVFNRETAFAQARSAAKPYGDGPSSLVPPADSATGSGRKRACLPG
jgi:hypothetical protein